MSQIIICGNDGLPEIARVLKNNSVKKLLIVGNGIKRLPLLQKFVDDIGIPYAIFNDFLPNPKYEDAQKGVEVFNEEQCDGILAIGGGTAIDVAKCIKLFCRLNRESCYLDQESTDNKICLIAVPTTAGTGSESTRFAVIYRDGKKYSVSHASILPDCALLVPEALSGLPSYQKKCSMLDALCQGIEAWWSVNSTEESSSYSQTAVDLIMRNMDPYLGSDDLKAAEAMLLASNYAGRAINIAMTTAPHAMSYKLTSMYGLPHGHAVAICLPSVWRFMLNNMDKVVDKRGEAHLLSVFERIALALYNCVPDEAVVKFSDMLANLGISYPKVQTNSDLKALCESVNIERLNNNPVSLIEKSLFDIYKQILFKS